MAKATAEQALVLEPSNELRFKGPFIDVVTAELKLFNPTEKRICFKVKTTAPKRYCVRPNSGVLESDGSVTVAVMLQPFEYDPSEKNKHKFMVQSMFAPDGRIDNQDQLWKDAPPESLMDTKLKCVFEMPDHASQAPVQESMLEETAKVVKTEPVSPLKPSAVTGGDDRKMLDEVRRLQSEVNSLRSENNQLKDEGARLRKVAMSDTVSSTPSFSQQGSGAMASQTASAFPPVIYIIAAVIIGLLIGKFIL
ncbi:vesicle-associated membrane protein/synaptobrevin-binding protein-like isoform X2 [Littorina saxatilis]|uniref:MSP domain-containing protein n=1 Tax=Littorina saxatilis TaxID=31220 RepID=A0AAN9BZ25_9CAEN